MVLHDKFVFVHMVKTGGSFLQNYFGLAIPGSRGTGRGHRRHKPALSLKDDQRFRFGSMRDPFSWYVSWWAFQANQKKPGNSLPTLLVPSFGKSIDNINKARGIVTQTSSSLSINFDILHKYDIGVMTYKFAETFCNFPTMFRREKFSIRPQDILVDAFIYVETLRDDLITLFRNCLFELSGSQEDLLRSLPDRNKSNHTHHSHYYNDLTLHWVKHKERHLFDLFPHYKETIEYVGDFKSSSAYHLSKCQRPDS